MKFAPFVQQLIPLLKMIFKSLIEFQPTRGCSRHVGDSKEQMIQVCGGYDQMHGAETHALPRVPLSEVMAARICPPPVQTRSWGGGGL